MDSINLSKPPPFPCIHCGRDLMLGDEIHFAALFYGIFFLRGEHDGFIGTTCPACLKTTFINPSKNAFDSFVIFWLNTYFEGLTFYHNFNYYSPSSLSFYSDQIVNIFDIANIVIHSNDKSDIENGILLFEETENQYEKKLYCSFLNEINSLMLPYVSVLYPDKNQVKELLQIEIQEQIRIIPRYVLKNDFLSITERFCAKFKFIFENQLNLLDSIVSQENNMSSIKNTLTRKGYDLNILNNNSSLLNQFIENYPKVSDNLLELSFHFHEILIYKNDFNSALNKKIIDINRKFKNNFNNHIINKIFYEILTDDLDKKFHYNNTDNQLKKFQTKQYSIDFLTENYNNFIFDIFKILIVNNLPYIYIFSIKNKYKLLYIDSVKNGIKNEKNYSIKKIGKSFKIIFNKKEFPETDKIGFNYIYFLICNRGNNYNHYQLNIITEKQNSEGIYKNFQLLSRLCMKKSLEMTLTFFKKISILLMAILFMKNQMNRHCLIIKIE